MTPLEKLHTLPSANLGIWPTPLHPLERFSEAIGAEVWMKRDDLQGVALAGNKIRKFNLVTGQALADGHNTLVTTGAAQSNSARTGATAAAMVGMDCHLILGGTPPPEATGNLLIDELVGATLHFVGELSWEAKNRAVEELVAYFNRTGRSAVAAPIGCSSPLGTLGFALAFEELQTQLDDRHLSPTALVHTTTSGGTHAGLLVGRALLNRDLPIIGIDAGRLVDDLVQQHHDLAVEAARLIDFDLELSPHDIRLVFDQLGPGYGQPTAQADEAIELLARTEGILVDPIYSAKGLAGLVAAVRSKTIDGPVVFWHTGGYQALFAG